MQSKTRPHAARRTKSQTVPPIGRPAAMPSATPTTTAPAGDARDLALAWESIAQEGHASAAIEAERYINQAIVEHPDDPVLLDSLAFIAQRRGDAAKARGLYEHALQADPTMIDAAANLGVIEARAGHFDRAVALWEDAFNRAPGRSAIGMNLAHISLRRRPIRQSPRLRRPRPPVQSRLPQRQKLRQSPGRRSTQLQIPLIQSPI